MACIRFGRGFFSCLPLFYRERVHVSLQAAAPLFGVHIGLAIGSCSVVAHAELCRLWVQMRYSVNGILHLKSLKAKFRMRNGMDRGYKCAVAHAEFCIRRVQKLNPETGFSFWRQRCRNSACATTPSLAHMPPILLRYGGELGSGIPILFGEYLAIICSTC